VILVPALAAATVVVGSKAFPESWILGEALAGLAASTGAHVEHRQNLGGTEIVAEAVREGSVDAYPEYTGTLREVVLHAPSATLADVRAALARDGLGVTDSLGFDDSYALAVTGALADHDALRTLSDLARHPELRAAFTHEFLGRADGWPGLQHRYGMRFDEVRGVEHHLAFEALAAGSADVVDVYTTDPEIARIGLRVLDDDRAFFPRYEAVVVYRLDLAARAPAALDAMQRLVGRVDRAAMARANDGLASGRETARQAAASLLRESLGPEAPRLDGGSDGPAASASVGAAVVRHLELVASSLVASVLLGVPLGVLAARRRRMAQVILGATGVLQTVPSLALLALLIPLLGIGVRPAIVALWLYGLLPVVQGTYTGLTTIPASLAESAEALGLTTAARIARIDLPLASPAILAGIRTSAVMSVGTATIAALVGAGGLGDPILQGITLRSAPLILAGAVPAAVLALAVQWGFTLLERAVVPEGLRIRTTDG
jgi:osmoprotectant transport system permease protein